MAFTYTFHGSTRLQGQGGDPTEFTQSFSLSSDEAIGNGDFSSLSDAECSGGELQGATFQSSSGTHDNILVRATSDDGTNFNTLYYFSEGAFATAGSYDANEYGDTNPNGTGTLTVESSE